MRGSDLRTFDIGFASVVSTMAGEGADPLRCNVGHRVGDDPELVLHRRHALSDFLGTPVVWMNQTHSTDIVILTDDNVIEDGMVVDADGVIIDREDSGGHLSVSAAVVTADCLPVCLATESGNLIAAVHAGRRGLEKGILSKAVALIRRRSSRNEQICAWIGASICGNCYEVPEQMRAQASLRYQSASCETSWGTPAIDLRAWAREELESICVTRIAHDDRCTFEDFSLHSYRRDPISGRQATIVNPYG